MHVHDGNQREVVLVVKDRRAGDLFQPLRPGDVIDVRMSDNDLFDRELMFGEQRENARNIVAGIDDNRFA